MIRARGRLGHFRIASCRMIQPGQFAMEWSRNWGLSGFVKDRQVANRGHGLSQMQSVSRLGTSEKYHSKTNLPAPKVGPYPELQ